MLFLLQVQGHGLSSDVTYLLGRSVDIVIDA